MNASCMALCRSRWKIFFYSYPQSTPKIPFSYTLGNIDVEDVNNRGCWHQISYFFYFALNPLPNIINSVSTVIKQTNYSVLTLLSLDLC
jgi:hypothetical protein